MRSDDSAAALDRDDDHNGADTFGPEGSGADPMDRAVDVDPMIDEELLEADLGERDADFGDDFDLEEPDDEPDLDGDEDDEAEMALLQELGIDLDAPDGALTDLGLGIVLSDDDPIDDEAAA